MAPSVPASTEADLVVVGSGIAGLVAAITAWQNGDRVVILTKSTLDESNTRYAQGGIAAAIGADDSPKLHWEDTIACGAGLNDWDAASVITAEARQAVELLIDLDVKFDTNGSGLALTREAAHSVPRVVHSGDATGDVVVSGLISAARRLAIPVFEHAMATRLLVQSGRAAGAEFQRGRSHGQILSSRILLATGGAGQLYNRTTNPSVATGDGLALAYRIGADLIDLEFFQFHPTALYLPGHSAFLISEAARGEGGVLRDLRGKSFMGRYHRDGDLAPRDVVSRAIWSEVIHAGAEHMVLDMTHLPAKRLESRFPTIMASCRRVGIDPALTPIPVAPAAHYFMGGIWTDLEGHTSVPGLLAAGEAACTGVHGANRLASNSLLEALIFGQRAALARVRDATPDWESQIQLGIADKGRTRFMGRRDLQRVTWNDVGIIRSEAGLERAAQIRVGIPTPRTTREHEDQNLALLSRLMGAAALMRSESRGAHFREDFPTSRGDWRGHIVVRRSVNDSVVMRFVPTATLAAEGVPA